MCKFNCIKCNHEIQIFKSSTKETIEDVCKQKNLKLLANLPLDPIITKNSDLGLSTFESEHKDNSSYLKELKILTDNLRNLIN